MWFGYSVLYPFFFFNLHFENIKLAHFNTALLNTLILSARSCFLDIWNIYFNLLLRCQTLTLLDGLCHYQFYSGSHNWKHTLTFWIKDGVWINVKINCATGKLCFAHKTLKIIASSCNILLMQTHFSTMQHANKSLIRLFERQSKQFCSSARFRLTDLTHGFTFYTVRHNNTIFIFLDGRNHSKAFWWSKME